MPRLSQTCRFLQSPSFPKSAVCSDWRTDPVHCDWPNTTSTHRKCNAPYIIVSFQVSFIRLKPERVTESSDRHSDNACMYLQYTSQQDDFCSPHTHTHITHYMQNTFELSIANTWTNNKTYFLRPSDETHRPSDETLNRDPDSPRSLKIPGCLSKRLGV